MSTFHTYMFHHDDDLSGWTNIEDFKMRVEVELSSKAVEWHSLAPEYIDHIKSSLRRAGWEGDGELGAALVPPFFAEEGDNYWFPVFHVKKQ